MKLECCECGTEFRADEGRGSGPAHVFDVKFVYVRVFADKKIAGLARLDRAAADMGGTLAERLAACTSQSSQRGICLSCCSFIAVRHLNAEQLDLGQNDAASVEARIKAGVR